MKTLMMYFNPITINLKADEPRDINDSLGLMCRYLDLDKKEEESKCVIGATKRVDYNILLRFCIRHELVFRLDFKDMSLDITFTPVTDNIASDDEILEEEKILQEMKASKERNKIERVKKNKPVKASEVLKDIEPEATTDMSFLDDLDDFDDDDL